MGERAKFGWRDFIAVFIALLRTVLLPLVILGIVLFVLSIIFTHLPIAA